jgi:iron(III) transport system substrate-binding protein
MPPGYPADYQAIISAAEQEGSVAVYSATDSASADLLLKDFRALYPKVQIRYYDLNSTEIYNRYLSETAANAETADVLWSGSMDLQLKLVADGHALTHHSPESAKMPKWAVYEDRAWGTTFEPLVIAYNKRLFPGGRRPGLARRSPASSQGAPAASRRRQADLVRPGEERLRLPAHDAG